MDLRQSGRPSFPGPRQTPSSHPVDTDRHPRQQEGEKHSARPQNKSNNGLPDPLPFGADVGSNNSPVIISVPSTTMRTCWTCRRHKAVAVADGYTQRTTQGRDANDSLVKVEERAAPRKCRQIINVNAAEKYAHRRWWLETCSDNMAWRRRRDGSRRFWCF